MLATALDNLERSQSKKTVVLLEGDALIVRLTLGADLSVVVLDAGIFFFESFSRAGSSVHSTSGIADINLSNVR
jgi:hypothetical protein